MSQIKRQVTDSYCSYFYKTTKKVCNENYVLYKQDNHSDANLDVLTKNFFNINNNIKSNIFNKINSNVYISKQYSGLHEDDNIKLMKMK